MKRIRLKTIPLALLTLSALLVVQAQSDRRIQPKKAKQKPASVRSPNQVEAVRAPVEVSRQGYQMVTDVLDGFGGESESDNYRVRVSSGGQPSAIGLSESDSYGVETGYVYASHIRRGDANADKAIDLGDVVYLLNYLFKGDAQPCPMESGDVNCDGVVDLGDVVYLLNYLFKGGTAPAC
jgi:hypothetical protein